MGAYAEDAERLLAAVGGPENIVSVAHCMTRMRFVLVDTARVDTEAVSSLAPVKGIVTQSGQFQVIIGNDVAQFYRDFEDVRQAMAPAAVVSAVAGEGGAGEGAPAEYADAAAAADGAPGARRSPWQRAMGFIGEVFAPVVPALICGGMVLGLYEALTPALATGSAPDLLLALHYLLGMVGDAVFAFLPVAIAWSTCRAMATTPVLGIVLGLVLVSPGLADGGLAGFVPGDGFWDLVLGMSYEGAALAPFLSALVLAYLERGLTCVVPEEVRMVVVPLCSLIPAVLVSLLVVAPAASTLGTYVALAVSTLLSSWHGVLLAGLICCLYPLLVMTGLHHFTIIIDLELMCLTGGTVLWPLLALSNIAQASAALGASVFCGRDSRAATYRAASLSCYLGVSEPALFGVNRPLRYPLVCGMAGAAIAGALANALGVSALSIGVGGLPGILSIVPHAWGGFAAAALVAVLVPVALCGAAGARRRLPAGADSNENGR